MRILTWLIAFLFLLSAFSDNISPLTWVLPSFIGLLFPLWFWLLVLLTGYWVYRRKPFAITGFIMLFLAQTDVQNYCPINITSPSLDTEDHLKVLSYNTCGLGKGRPSHLDDAKDIFSFMKKQDPDIICLQEIQFRQRQQVEKGLLNYPYTYMSQQRKGQGIGVMVLSKYPITQQRSIFFENTGNHAALLELNVNGKLINLLNCHLESFSLSLKDKASYKHVIRGNVDQQSVERAFDAIFPKLSNAFQERTEQALILRKMMDQFNDPIIICGDFNDTSTSYTYQTLRGNLQDAFANDAFGPSITFNERGFWFKIDHLFHDDHFETQDFKVHRVDYSDHYPFTATLNILTE